ncbi:recombinase family protein [Streptomyces decoyicus]|uniref:recombinase family protein n=1 Tax=Streptomyces decoyicus TaxID=249567 RepID=UPI00345D97D8
MTTAQLLESATETALTAGTVADRPLRAVIYARVSQDPRQQLRSVSQQIDECTAECQRRGWTVAKVFTDNDRSASRYATKERPQYDRLIDFLRTGGADVLVTWESSRAQRDLEAYVRLRRVAEDHGVQWSYKGRLYDLTRTDDRFTTGLDALLDERESSVTRDRILRDKQAHAAKGLPNGRLLYGYTREYDTRTGDFVRSVIREDQAAVVREAVRRIAAGEPIAKLCREFNRRGLRTNRGSYWRGYTLRAMVTNPGYLGKRVHRGVIIGDAEWPPIMKTPEDRQAFYACVRRLSAPERKTTRPGGVKHLSSGIATCGACGGKLSAGHREKRPDQSRGELRYFCRGTEIHHGNCVSIKKATLDQHITALVIERLSRPDAVELLADDEEQAESIAALLAEAAEKRATLEEIADKVAAGDMTVTMAARIEAQLLPEVEALEQQAQEASTAPVLRGLIRSDIAEVWPSLPLAQQREVIKALMDVTLMPTLADRPGKADMEARKQMRWELGQRLRELRRGYGLLGMGERQLAQLAGWPPHKVNNAERGKQTPTADEVRLWCRLVGAESEADTLVALIPPARLRPADRIRVAWKSDL